MKKLFRYIKPYQVYVIFTVALLIFGSIITLLQPRLLSQFINDGVINRNNNAIIKIGIILLAAVVIEGIVGTASNVLKISLSQKFAHDIRNDVFETVALMSIEQKKSFTYDFLTKTLENDIDILKSFLELLSYFVGMIIIVTGGIIIIFTYDVLYGIILIMSLGIILLAEAVYFVKLTPIYKNKTENLDKFSDFINEKILGIRHIKAYVKEDYEKNGFENINNDLVDANSRKMLIIAKYSSIVLLIAGLTAIIVIYISGFKIEAKTINLGDIIAVITYFIMVITAPTAPIKANKMLNVVSLVKESAKRINEIFDTKPLMTDGDNDKARLIKRGEITFQNVNFAYQNMIDEPTLQGISLNIKGGEFFAFLGNAGSGKSTIANLILRFYDVTAGEICINGIPIKDYYLTDLHQKIIIVSQKSEPFIGTIRENIIQNYNKNESSNYQNIGNILKIVQLDEFAAALQNGDDAAINRNAENISSGQKQLLSIAKAIVKKPEILILDDCTYLLDFDTETRLYKALKQELKGITVIIFSRRINSIKSCDRIAVLENGMISAAMSHEKLMINSSCYREMYFSQHGGISQNEILEGNHFRLDIDKLTLKDGVINDK